MADAVGKAKERDVPPPEHAGPAEKPSVTLLADVLAETKQDPVWIVRGFLALGAVGIVSGDYYIGKTTLLELLLAHIAAGRPFLGFDVLQPLSVLYWQAEGNRRMFAERVACACFHAGIDAAKLDFGFPPADFVVPFDSPDFARFVLASGRKVVVCDSVGYFMNDKADENSNSDWKRYVMKPLRAIGAPTGISFLLAHHYGKPAENRTGRHRTRGASAIGGDCDTVLRIEAPDGEKAARRILYFDKVRDAEAPATMVLTFERQKAQLLRDEAEDGAEIPTPTESRAKEKAAAKVEADRRAKEDVALLFRRTPAGLTAEEIVEAFHRHKTWVADVLGEFHAQGLIRRGTAERVNARSQKRLVGVWLWVSQAAEKVSDS